MDTAPRRKLVEVLYFEGCPNHRETLSLARQVVADVGIEAEVKEVEVESVEEARQLRFLGSPSMHVDGLDVECDARSSTAFALAAAPTVKHEFLRGRCCSQRGSRKDVVKSSSERCAPGEGARS